MNRTRQQRGITLSGLLYTCAFLGLLAIIAMRLFPLYNEKMKVDLALESVAGQPDAAKMSKIQIARRVGRHFEVSDVDRWTPSEFAKLLNIETDKGSKRKTMSLIYEIRGPFFGDLDIILKYNNKLMLGGSVTD